MQVRKRITVADVMRSAKVPKTDKDGKPMFKLGDDGKPVLDNGLPIPLMGGIDMTETQPIYVILGKAKESKEGKPTQYGTYMEYFGEFEAVRSCDGERFFASSIIFPPPTDSVVDSVFHSAKAADPTAVVSFAFVIGTEKFVRGEETKFRFTCQPIQIGDLATTDPLADIRAAVAKASPGLLAAPTLPVTEPAKEPAPIAAPEAAKVPAGKGAKEPA